MINNVPMSLYALWSFIFENFNYNIYFFNDHLKYNTRSLKLKYKNKLDFLKCSEINYKNKCLHTYTIFLLEFLS